MGHVEHKETQVTETHVNCENYLADKCHNSWGYCAINEASKKLMAEKKCDHCGGKYVQHTFTFTRHWKEYVCDCGQPGEEYRDRYGNYLGIFCCDKCAKDAGYDLNWEFDASYAGECLNDDY